MTLTALRDDALSSTSTGFELRLGLPWIRSMPLSSLSDLAVAIDGHPAPIDIVVGGRRVPATGLAGEAGWWFIQDRLVIAGGLALAPGTHRVAVSFTLMVPYLEMQPGTPLVLPFHIARDLTLDAAGRPSVSLDVAAAG